MRAYLACGLCAASACAIFDAPGYRGPESDHFDGEKFVNLGTARPASAATIVWWLLTADPTPWPETITAWPQAEAPPDRVDDGTIRITNIGHATLLVQMDGLNILTDPVWSAAVGPEGFALQQRMVPPAVRFEDLPPIDVVLLSHNHYDHLDVPTLRRLAVAHGPRIAAGLGTAALLRDVGVRGVRDFDWWATRPLSRRVRVHSVPVQHFARRGVFDGDTTLWTGFVVEGPSGRVYFAGDTGYGPHFAAVRKRLGPMRVALLPIGAYKPRDIMRPVHINPAEAVQAHLDLGAKTSIAMHYGTFKQADDGYVEPVEDLAVARTRLGVPKDAFRALDFGVGFEAPD